MKPYNGYRNYPTWNAALWINNDEGLYLRRLEIVQEADNQSSAAEALEEWFNEVFPSPVTTGPLADILGFALAHIEWRELAEHWWEERNEEN